MIIYDIMITHQQQEVIYWPQSSRLRHLDSKLLHAFLPATAGTVWLRSLRWLKHRMHTNASWVQTSQTQPWFRNRWSCLLTQYQPHGKRLEVDRIVNPHVNLQRWDEQRGSLLLSFRFNNQRSCRSSCEPAHLISIQEQLILMRLQFKLLLHLFLLLWAAGTVILWAYIMINIHKYIS